MGKTYDAIDDRLAQFIGKQKMFFVATAPSGNEGHVNLSPKGYNSFAILGPNTVAYADLGGSGIETVAHLRQNGRITFMFCAFEGPANILRLYGKGQVIQHDEPGFAEAMTPFPDIERARNIIIADVHRIADSCGWGVPFYSFEGERDQLTRAVTAKPVEDWWKKNLDYNNKSIDGLKGLIPND
ncbi:MAG: pyridoxamine 5'-phosphate oxidase family protein [Pseudomonadota bacterium]